MINAPEQWDPALELGHDAIDRQHRALFEMILELDRRMSEGDFGQGVLDALQGMKAYAATHFEEEEAIMSRAAWPRFQEHQAMHGEFMRKTNLFSAEALADSEWTSLDLLRFLLTWLVQHIKVQDRGFFAWKEKQAQAQA